MAEQPFSLEDGGQVQLSTSIGIAVFPDHGPIDCKMVSAIIQLGQGLGLKLLAEGVENQEQLDYLQAVGCDSYQGYYCSKPLPAAEFIALLAAQSKERNDEKTEPTNHFN